MENEKIKNGSQKKYEKIHPLSKKKKGKIKTKLPIPVTGILSRPIQAHAEIGKNPSTHQQSQTEERKNTEEETLQ